MNIEKNRFIMKIAIQVIEIGIPIMCFSYGAYAYIILKENDLGLFFIFISVVIYWILSMIKFIRGMIGLDT